MQYYVEIFSNKRIIEGYRLYNIEIRNVCLIGNENCCYRQTTGD